MPISRLEARELMSRGYEIGATVLNGLLQREDDGTWSVEGKSIDEWLRSAEGQEVMVIATAIHEGRGRRRLCPVCGTEYEGYDCPRCRRARQRLRGSR